MLATKRFRVSRRFARWLYAGLVLLGLTTLLIGALASPANFEPKTIFAGFALVAVAGLQLHGCFLVQEIEIEEDGISFHPVEVRASFGELGAIKAIYRDSIGSVQRMTFLPSAQRWQWLPGNLVWAPGFVSISLTGADGDAICAELGQRLPSTDHVSRPQ